MHQVATTHLVVELTGRANSPLRFRAPGLKLLLHEYLIADSNCIHQLVFRASFIARLLVGAYSLHPFNEHIHEITYTYCQ